jgi:O-acetylhomoserine (thiol)-lyase
MKLETMAIHAGFAPDPITKVVATPIYQTASYAFDDTQHGADLFDLKGRRVRRHGAPVDRYRARR